MRALVTGAGGRLGRAMAVRLARRGHAVAVHYHESAAGAEETAAMVQAEGAVAETVRGDLLDRDVARALLPRAAGALGGPVTVLVNNASIFERDDIRTATPEGWDRHLGSNLEAPFWLMQAMAEQGLEPGGDGEPLASGLVVNMVDQRVLKPTPEFATYSLAKAGLWWLTRTGAQALAPAIRVNAIAPGPTLRASRQSEAHFAAQRAATILGRGGDPEGIADALDYLLGARAVTGQVICVDGGQHLGWRTRDVLGGG
ncbi:NAD(P)-dependent dehydrogenase (short-subunit alcohol dehydrogenase family) [Hasllibacter halocynthiae]|uniref:NAD(P)-dependent dehydrogenase (Short-subunit alcohol dehydrogenase family) n=1 Tax=Hasllibacter halocynthiae TaxID=595589 RepID=A0A2T0X3U5_9RHOB|nr:SDR family oxidoreductase [Hasllibacter halocynthiae]PRY93587.1 NAD(P)-dependent dehydrogenase (short-subunit alcohol dehydrogenase family) [Hasllibacter halocynthiae]